MSVLDTLPVLSDIHFATPGSTQMGIDALARTDVAIAEIGRRFPYAGLEFLAADFSGDGMSAAQKVKPEAD